ncbi:MAG TPA: GMP synthase subunit A [Candidatus Thermoplasmatota archaeon]|nr:GMP synthase subunit A [Candidatus Thermoplasmatota archaeon]
MVRIFVVDNGGQWTHREWRVLKYLDVETEIVPFDTPWEKLQDLDGLVLSGGAPTGVTLEGMGRNSEYMAKAPYPILGICAGAQVMGLHYGGALAPARAPEFGKAELVLDDPTGGKILAGLPERSIVWENHNDEVARLPPGFRLLAHSANCAMQAMESERLARHAVQFHPEVEHTQFGERVFRNFVDLCRR